jgi:hypothetical protein
MRGDDMGALRAILIVISMVLMANQVSASPRHYMGAGTVSCGTWLEVRKSRGWAEVENQSWVLGYVSDANFYQQSTDFLAAPDAQAIFAWLDNYCRQHPLEKLLEASQSLIYELTMRAAGAGTKTK